MLCWTHITLALEKTLKIRSSEKHLLVAAAWDDEDSGMEQMHVKELGKALPRDYCRSLNLCTPRGDAPTPSFLCLEGNSFFRLALKAFQNFAVCGENIYERTWFHFLLPCSLETPCWLPRRMGKNKWLCSKCHFRTCCVFYLVICGIWSRLALYLIFRSAVGNTLILQLSSNIFRYRDCKVWLLRHLLGSFCAECSAHKGPFFMPKSSHCCYKPNKQPA